MNNITDGYYNGQILAVTPIASRFNRPMAFDLEFEIGIFGENNAPLGKSMVYLEISNEFGVGFAKDKTQKQITIDTLSKLGYAGGEDMSRLGELVNKPCRINYRTKDDSGKVYTEPRCYFTFKRENKTISANDANALIAQMNGGAAPSASASAPANPFGGFSAAPAAAPQTAPAAPVNPFSGF